MSVQLGVEGLRQLVLGAPDEREPGTHEQPVLDGVIGDLVLDGDGEDLVPLDRVTELLFLDFRFIGLHLTLLPLGFPRILLFDFHGDERVDDLRVDPGLLQDGIDNVVSRDFLGGESQADALGLHGLDGEQAFQVGHVVVVLPALPGGFLQDAVSLVVPDGPDVHGERPDVPGDDRVRDFDQHVDVHRSPLVYSQLSTSMTLLIRQLSSKVLLFVRFFC